MWKSRVTTVVASFVLAGFGAIPAHVQAAAPSTSHLDCSTGKPLCTEVVDPEQVFGEDHYVGHDEPSLLFYSNVAGSGNTNLYQLTLPHDPPTVRADRGLGSWN